jgi:hypothetical protein
MAAAPSRNKACSCTVTSSSLSGIVASGKTKA